ncbi:hypothetical protein [Pseudomonas sp. HY7a-MNA-CIBAN-0227]|uniref:hypothetical protein n=1 Tax=Pseudomonas sp. HY7a-MNA-CIBAN-0227 TaxID=3140474 RepID=UPI00332AC8D3
MKNSIKSICAFSLLTALCNVAYADFILRVPTEESSGGPLPNGTISFVTKSSIPNESPSDVPADVPAEVPPVELNPMEVCDAKKVKVDQLLATEYVGVSYGYAGIGSYMSVEQCVIELVIPKSSSSECTGNYTYEDKISGDLKALDYKVTSYEIQGACS